MGIVCLTRLLWYLIRVGCGDGRWLSFAAHHYGCHCWGVDIDSERLELAKLRCVEVI